MIPAEPPPELRVRWRVNALRSLRELMAARGLVRTLAERDIRVRYKQALLGVSWAVIYPLVYMVVFTFFVRRVAVIDTQGVPYPVFTFVALLPWMFFSSSVTQGGSSLVSNAGLLNKIYCPREVFPMASVIVAGFDMLIATGVLGLLFVITGFAPKSTSYWVPVLLLMQVALTLGLTMIVSATLVYLRDLRHALPMLLQFGIFATPVAWGIDRIPESLLLPYAIVNPLAAVIDGYRRVILFGQPPSFELLIPGAVTTVLMLIGGWYLFKRLERGFADVA